MDTIFQVNLGELLYNAAAIMSLSAYMMSNVLWLRIFIIVASIIYVIAGVVLGITSMSAWNTTYLLINFYHVVVILKNNSSVFLEDHVKGLYLGPFSSLTSREFKTLISINPVRDSTNQKVITEGETTHEMLVILRGTADVVVAGKSIATLEEGDFIGEMSFIGKCPALQM